MFIDFGEKGFQTTKQNICVMQTQTPVSSMLETWCHSIFQCYAMAFHWIQTYPTAGQYHKSQAKLCKKKQSHGNLSVI